MNLRSLPHAYQAFSAAIMLATAGAAIPERPEPEMLILENEAMKIGIDRSMGASFTWLSWQAHPENIINIHDPGRLIQQSYYAGEKLDRHRDEKIQLK